VSSAPGSSQQAPAYTATPPGPAAFTEIVTVVRDKFGLTQLVMAGDRGVITVALNELRTPSDG